MRLVSYRIDGGDGRYGMVRDDGVVDLGKRLPERTLRQLLAAPDGLDRAAALAGEAPDHPLDAIAFLPVIPDPDKILAIQMNYKAHIEELRRHPKYKDVPIPDRFPSFFLRTSGSQVGHREALVKPAATDSFDYEAELAVIIGRACRHVPEAEAMSVIAGYSCYNEGSVRDWQMRAPQITSGKCWEKSGSFGPFLVTANEIPDPTALRMQARINGEVRQDTLVSDLLFSIPVLISYLSTIMTLLPGDVIVTGTPGRIGGFDKPRWLQPGDRIEIDIERIGVLENEVVAEVQG